MIEQKFVLNSLDSNVYAICKWSNNLLQSSIKKAKEQTYAALCQNPIPALGYFMEHFLDGFELTLDELQN